MTWHTKSFDALTTRELYEILKGRADVFVVEQVCPYLDPDGLDYVSEHIFAEENGNIAAYCRITPKGTRFKEIGIGRLITTRKYRGTGLGREIMRRAVDYIVKDKKERTIRISAQAYLQKFYESLGFHIASDVYLEDGIPHYEMVISN
ncbi:MAG: GNAT family N-acetyltransferase [Oscillospiraceae bacterium]|nr:GNAT family N-acetyltransferase [Oscillospiraceae bacterium]